MTNSTQIKQLSISFTLQSGREETLTTTHSGLISYYSKVLRGSKPGDVVSLGVYNNNEGEVALGFMSYSGTRRIDVLVNAASVDMIDNPYMSDDIFDGKNDDATKGFNL